MEVCAYCGEEIEMEPFYRRGNAYCSRTCAEEHESESASSSDDDNLDEDLMD